MTSAPDPRKGALGWALLAVGFVLACIGSCAWLDGCAPSTQAPAITPRAEARSVVYVLAYGVRGAYQACEAVDVVHPEPGLAQKCRDAIDPARDAVIAAAHAVDAWTDADNGQLACAAADVLDALDHVRELLGLYVRTWQPEFEDAIVFAKAIAPACVRAPVDASAAKIPVLVLPDPYADDGGDAGDDAVSPKMTTALPALGDDGGVKR